MKKYNVIVTQLNKSNYDFTKIPFDDLVRIGQRSMLYGDYFIVSWIINRFCNYKCSYCWAHGRSDTKDFRDTDLCLRTIDSIKKQARERGFNSFHFSFSGGEPTLHPGYLTILKHLADDMPNTNNTNVHMTSNCSRNMKWFNKYVRTIQTVNSAALTCSYHREYVSAIDKRIALADKLELCQEWDINVTINCVMVPKWFWKIYEECMYFHERGINVTLKPQSDHHASYVVSGYDDEMLEQLHNGMPKRTFTHFKKQIERPHNTSTSAEQWQYSELDISRVMKDDSTVPQEINIEFVDDKGKFWYMDEAERFNAFNFNKFIGWECSSGYRSIIIREPDGSIKRSYSCEDKPLGYIFEDFKLFDKPMPCVSDSCVSSADSKIPKRKAGTKLPLWPGDDTFRVEIE